jgi:tetratricopeptide (TPR) repeat protein
VVGRWHFVQPLFRSVLLDELSHTARARLHARVVDVLEPCGADDPTTLDVLASHSAAAHQLPGMARRAVQHALRAAEDAARVFAWERAASHYERAVEVIEHEPDRDDEMLCDTLLALGDAHIRVLERHHAMPVFLRAAQLAQQLGSSERLARAAIGYGYMAKAGVADERARELWDRALAVTDDVALRAMLLGARATHMTFAGADVEARTASGEALALARTTSDPRALAQALASRCITLWGTADAPVRLALAQELTGLGVLAHNDEWMLDGIELTGVPLLELGEVDEFDRVVADLDAVGRRTGRGSSIAQATQWMALRALMRGDVVAARDASRRVVDIAPNAPNFTMGLMAQQYVVERLVGNHHDLLPLVAELARQHPEVVAWSAVHARALAEAGQVEAAGAVLADVVARLDDAPRNWTWVAALAVGAEAAARLGDARLAAAIEPHLEPYAGRLAVVASGTSCEGAIDRYRALLAAVRGDADAATARFDAALALEARTGATALTVATRLDRGAWLRHLTPQAAAGAVAEAECAAHADAERLGMALTPSFPSALGNFRPAK